jgi:DNA replication and repair protein RecF
MFDNGIRLLLAFGFWLFTLKLLTFNLCLHQKHPTPHLTPNPQHPTSNIQHHLLALQLQSISLVQFKNYPAASFTFSERIVGICGPNGTGKTNLLDALYYLCFTKSYFTRSDAQNVLTGSAGFRIEGHVELENEHHKVVCVLRENGKKEFSLDNDLYERFALHVGKFPCVVIAPDDVEIITGASEARRRMIDALLSQLDTNYLMQLIDYNRILQQRNSYLRSIDTRRPDTSLLDVYDKQLVVPGNYIFEKRRNFISGFVELVLSFYKQIAGNEEGVALSYKSQLLQSSFNELLIHCRSKDILLQRTNAGIHRDDLEIQLQEQQFKALASQGQRKSLLFALKLAEFETLKESKGFSPLLLLDDVFEKLDAKRMHNLLEWVCVKNNGQLFITDTHLERIDQHLQDLKISYQLIELERP